MEVQRKGKRRSKTCICKPQLCTTYIRTDRHFGFAWLEEHAGNCWNTADEREKRGRINNAPALLGFQLDECLARTQNVNLKQTSSSLQRFSFVAWIEKA